MTSEVVNTEGNPIAQGAEKIRSTVGNLVRENLEGIFPKNWQWKHGDYNLIFVIEEGFGNISHGFYERAQMIVLTPKGEFKSGRVGQYVGDDYSYWKFDDAELKQATDLEIVRFGPQLVSDLFKQLSDEMHEEENPQKIAKGINFLYANSEFYKETLAISRHALVEMGEDDPTLVHIDAAQPSVQGVDRIIKSMLQPEDALEQKKAAIDLFMNKEKLKTEMAGIASNMKAQLVKDRFAQIIRGMVEGEIFPESQMDESEIKNVRFYSQGNHRNLFWHISPDGQVLEVNPSSKETNFCAEHLLAQAPQILEYLINKSAKRIFPRLKVF